MTSIDAIINRQLLRWELERKRTEEALRESADCLRLVMESASNGIIVVDAEGMILLTNPHVDTQFGYERGELPGQPVERLMPARLRPQGSDRAGVFLIRPDDRSVSPVRECVGLRKDGTEFPFTMIFFKASWSFKRTIAS